MDTKQKRTKTILYSSLEILCAFLLSLFGCCWDWVNLSFTLSKISTPQYWNNVAISTGMYSCACLLGTFFKLQRSELNNQEYDKELKDYRVALEWKDKTFVSFINNILNPKKKKERLIEKYDKKLSRLDTFAKEKWRLDFNDAIASGDADNFNFSSKASKRHYQRKMELERLKVKSS